LNALLCSAPGTALRVALTFAVFCGSAVIFRAPNLQSAAIMLKRMLVPTAGLPSLVPVRCFYLASVLVVLGHLLGQRGVWRKLGRCVPVPIQSMSFAALLTLAMILAPDASKAFVYFQF
jgi:alginate O-acetyltransferase complex protein AlgI